MKRLFMPAVLTACCAALLNAPVNADASQEFVPQWAKKAVWYQIFPERFRNGDVSNDPTVADIAGADPAEPPKAWQIHPWGSDWYALQDYEIANGQSHVATHLLRRRYGGDLQGVIDKLDYLSELGINAIYLNPIFDSPSLHKYDSASYHHVDPNFGPDPDGDRLLMAKENPIDPSTWVWTKADELVLSLIEQAHKKGIRVIFDGVFNHMGINSFAFQDVMKNQQASPYKDWFTITSFDDPEAGTQFDYEGWFGVKSLPEFKEDENGLVDGPKDYVFAATRRWMNPKGKGTQYGVDGWRLDVAYCIAHGFWKDWRKLVKSINPDAYLTAEIVDSPDKVKPFLQGDEFDGEMNYNFAFTAAEFLFNPNDMAIMPSEFDQKLAELRTLYPEGVAYVVQNLFGSHDSNRVGSHIKNKGIENFRNWGTYFNTSQAVNNRNYDVSKPGKNDIELQKLFVLLQMTYVGAPMIYYGDEVGMWGSNDPDSRKPMLWSDIKYDNEVTNPDGSKRSADTVEVNHSLKDYYSQLIHLRTSHPALTVGSYKTLLADDNANVFAYQRQHEGQTIWVVLNNAAKETTVSLPASGVNSASVLFGDTSAKVNGGALRLSLAGKTGAVLLIDND